MLGRRSPRREVEEGLEDYLLSQQPSSQPKASDDDGRRVDSSALDRRSGWLNVTHTEEGGNKPLLRR